MKRWTLAPLLVLIILVASCSKQYFYTQYGRTFDGKIVPNRQETISAKSDLDAYDLALATFASRVLVSKQIVAEASDSAALKDYTPFPYSYTLVTPEGERVRGDKLNATDRRESQEKVFKLFEARAKSSKVSLDRKDILDRDVIQ